MTWEEMFWAFWRRDKRGVGHDFELTVAAWVLGALVWIGVMVVTAFTRSDKDTMSSTAVSASAVRLPPGVIPDSPGLYQFFPYVHTIFFDGLNYHPVPTAPVENPTTSHAPTSFGTPPTPPQSFVPFYNEPMAINPAYTAGNTPINGLNATTSHVDNQQLQPSRRLSPQAPNFTPLIVVPPKEMKAVRIRNPQVEQADKNKVLDIDLVGEEPNPSDSVAESSFNKVYDMHSGSSSTLSSQTQVAPTPESQHSVSSTSEMDSQRIVEIVDIPSEPLMNAAKEEKEAESVSTSSSPVIEKSDTESKLSSTPAPSAEDSVATPGRKSSEPASAIETNDAESNDASSKGSSDQLKKESTTPADEIGNKPLQASVAQSAGQSAAPEALQSSRSSVPSSSAPVDNVPEIGWGVLSVGNKPLQAPAAQSPVSEAFKSSLSSAPSSSAPVDNVPQVGWGVPSGSKSTAEVPSSKSASVQHKQSSTTPADDIGNKPLQASQSPVPEAFKSSPSSVPLDNVPQTGWGVPTGNKSTAGVPCSKGASDQHKQSTTAPADEIGSKPLQASQSPVPDAFKLSPSSDVPEIGWGVPSVGNKPQQAPAAQSPVTEAFKSSPSSAPDNVPEIGWGVPSGYRSTAEVPSVKGASDQHKGSTATPAEEIGNKALQAPAARSRVPSSALVSNWSVSSTNFAPSSDSGWMVDAPRADNGWAIPSGDKSTAEVTSSKGTTPAAENGGKPLQAPAARSPALVDNWSLSSTTVAASSDSGWMVEAPRVDNGWAIPSSGWSMAERTQTQQPMSLGGWGESHDDDPAGVIESATDFSGFESCVNHSDTAVSAITSTQEPKSRSTEIKKPVVSPITPKVTHVAPGIQEWQMISKKNEERIANSKVKIASPVFGSKEISSAAAAYKVAALQPVGKASERKVEPEIQSKEPKTETEVEEKTEPITEEKAEEKTAGKTEEKPEEKTEAVTRTKFEPKEPKCEAVTEPITVEKAEQKSEEKTGEKAEQNAEGKADPETLTKSEPKEPISEPETQTKSEPKEQKSEPKTEPPKTTIDRSPQGSMWAPRDSCTKTAPLAAPVARSQEWAPTIFPRGELLLRLKVKLPNGKIAYIEFHEGDNIREISERWCRVWKVPDPVNQAKQITAGILAQLEKK